MKRIDSCAAGLLGGALVVGSANLLGVAAVAGAFAGPLSGAGPLACMAFGAAGLAVTVASMVGGALGGGVAGGCFRPPPGSGPPGTGSGSTLVLVSFGPCILGTALSLAGLALNQISVVLFGFVIEEMGSLLQLGLFLPLFYRTWMELRRGLARVQ